MFVIYFFIITPRYIRLNLNFFKFLNMRKVFINRNVLDHNHSSLLDGFEFLFPWISFKCKFGLFSEPTSYLWFSDCRHICEIICVILLLYLSSQLSYRGIIYLLFDTFFPHAFAKFTGLRPEYADADVIVIDRFSYLFFFFALVLLSMPWSYSFTFFFDNFSRVDFLCQTICTF
jgi:hypothetical protein